MQTKELLRIRMKEKNYTKTRLQIEVGCSERTLRKYLNGTTTSGRYLTKILEILDITVEEWNACENVRFPEV